MPENHEIHHRIDRLEQTLTESLSLMASQQMEAITQQKELTNAVKSLVVLETEHKATRDTLSRYGEKLEKHDARLDTIEQKLPYYDILVKIGGRVGMIALTFFIAGLLGYFFVFE